MNALTKSESELLARAFAALRNQFKGSLTISISQMNQAINATFALEAKVANLAAAPELLAALDRIASGQFDSTVGSIEQVNAMRAVARAAIAKAGAQ